MTVKIHYLALLIAVFLASGFSQNIETDNYSITLPAGWAEGEDEFGDTVIANGDYTLDITYFEDKQDRDAFHEVSIGILEAFGATVTDGGSKTLGSYPVEIKDYSLTFMMSTSVGKIYLVDAPNGYFSISLDSETETIDAAIITGVESAIAAMQVSGPSSLAGYGINNAIRAQLGHKKIIFNENSSVYRVEAFTLDGARIKVLPVGNNTWIYPNAVLPVFLKATGTSVADTWLLRK